MSELDGAIFTAIKGAILNKRLGDFNLLIRIG